MTRTSSYFEFGSAIAAPEAVAVTNLACATAGLFYDAELVTCVNAANESLDQS